MSHKAIATIALAGALGALFVVSPVAVTSKGTLAIGTALAANAGNGGGHGNGGAHGNGGIHGHSAAGLHAVGHDPAAPGGGHGKSLGRLHNDHDLDDMH